jgi:argininosuccinate lyase
MRQVFAVAACAVVALTHAGVGYASERHDDFDHLVEINQASLAMLVEEQLLDRDLAKRIAAAVLQIAEEQARPGSQRSSNYLDFEKRLLDIVGPEGSRLHTGRSRQDIGSTSRRMVLREAALDAYGELLAVRTGLIAMAAEHEATIIPAYTHGVQAQPTSLAHYLLAFDAAFSRDLDRLELAYDRLNRSPLGAAALGTSGFPVNRQRLAELLGFDEPVENSFDANFIASIDSKLDLVNALSTSAIVVGQFIENLHTQYQDPSPWFVFPDEETDVSSIMPQKRNPRRLDAVRLNASMVVSAAHGVAINAHNVNSGMNDYRPATQSLITVDTAIAMYQELAGVFRHIEVDRERALAEVNADYSVMTEVADTLMREGNVPFRTAHHFASELTRHGKEYGKTPAELGPDLLKQVYRESIGKELPIPVERIQAALDASSIVRSRRGFGGTQPEEIRRMLQKQKTDLASRRQWQDEQLAVIADSREELRRKTRAFAL